MIKVVKKFVFKANFQNIQVYIYMYIESRKKICIEKNTISDDIYCISSYPDHVTI